MAALAIGAATARAQTGVANPADAPDREHGAQPANEALAERRFLRNELALVVAGTWESAADETSFTIGAEYERRFTPGFGVRL